MSTNKVFANGIIFKRNEYTPQWIVGNLSINEKDAIEFIKANSKNGWVNLSIKESYKDKTKYYIELDTYQKAEVSQEPKANNDDLPF